MKKRHDDERFKLFVRLLYPDKLRYIKKEKAYIILWYTNSHNFTDIDNYTSVIEKFIPWSEILRKKQVSKKSRKDLLRDLEIIVKFRIQEEYKGERNMMKNLINIVKKMRKGQHDKEWTRQYSENFSKYKMAVKEYYEGKGDFPIFDLKNGAIIMVETDR